MDVSRSELELINRSALESSSSLRWPVEKHLNPPVKDRRDAAPGKSTPSVRAMWKGRPPAGRNCGAWNFSARSFGCCGRQRGSRLVVHLPPHRDPDSTRLWWVRPRENLDAYVSDVRKGEPPAKTPASPCFSSILLSYWRQRQVRPE
jgi:hypothetical protein